MTVILHGPRMDDYRFEKLIFKFIISAYDYATHKLEVKQISKIPKQIVLFFETNFKLANITILGCIETLFNSVLSLKKESNNSFKSLPLYLEVEDIIRDLAKLVKLVQPVDQ